MANLCFLKSEKVATAPPPSDFDGLPALPPGKVVPPFFVHENDREGCKTDYLYALGNFLYRFRANGGKTVVMINLTKAEIAYNFSGSDLNKWLRIHCH